MDQISEAQAAYLKRFRRYWIARNDLDEANEAIAQIIGFDLKRSKSGAFDPLLVLLTTAMVVSYARPFVNTRGKDDLADKALPGSILKSLSKSERKLHESLLMMRNKEVAHSDIDFLELSIKFIPDGAVAIFKNSREPLYRNELFKLHKMVQKIISSIDAECELIRKKIPIGIRL